MKRVIKVHSSKLVALICPGCLQRARRKIAADGVPVGLMDGTFTCASCGWTGSASDLTREMVC
jgi:hypothetical protein